MQWFRCAISPTQPPQKAKNASSWAGWYGLDFQAFKCADAFDCVRLAREKRLRYTVARATRSAPVRDQPPRAQPPRAQPCALSAPAHAQGLDGKGQGKAKGEGRAQGDDAAREKAREAARKRAARFSKPPPRPQRETRSSAPETLAPRGAKGAASVRLKEQFTHSASPRAAGKRKRPAANKVADGGGAGDDGDDDDGGGGGDSDGDGDGDDDDDDVVDLAPDTS